LVPPVNWAGRLASDVPDADIVEGDIRDPLVVSQTLMGAEAVISTLAMADISKGVTDLSDNLRTIIREMRDASLKRIIAVGGASVFREREDLPDFLVNVAAEHRRQWEYLKTSPKDWTLVCPVFFNDDLPDSRYRVAREALPEGSESVMIHDIAEFIVDELERNEYHRCRVGIVSDLIPVA
jgi:putative NADH-flavin reductase